MSDLEILIEIKSPVPMTTAAQNNNGESAFGGHKKRAELDIKIRLSRHTQPF